MSDAPQAPSFDETGGLSTGTNDEPVGGGAESTPDPARAPESMPDHDIEGDDEPDPSEIGHASFDETNIVRANDELDGGVAR